MLRLVCTLKFYIRFYLKDFRFKKDWLFFLILINMAEAISNDLHSILLIPSTILNSKIKFYTLIYH